MSSKIIFFLLSVFIFNNLYSQFTDNFSDGDFRKNPTWNGDTNKFEINTSYQLHLISSSSDTSYLSTKSNIVLNSEWHFFVKQAFNSSSGNYSRLYLTSDNENLKKPLNGYFVQIGSTSDNISLWKQSGNQLTELINGTFTNVGKSVNNINLKIINNNGEWKLFSDTLAIGNYVLEGTATDSTYKTSSYFGIFCKYTSSNSQKFYFDDFIVEPIQVDTTAPEILKIETLDSNQIKIYFNEAIDSLSATNTYNYFVNGNIGNPNLVYFNSSNPKIATLSFSKSFIYDTEYLLTTNGIKDINGNTILTSENTFSWYNIKQGDVIINEIMPDPDPPVELPNAEYIELYNNTNKKISLDNWKLIIDGSEKTILSGEILPNNFVIIGNQTDDSILNKYGIFIGLNSFSLPNSGASLCLKSDKNVITHYLEYNSSWYHNKNKEKGGWSLELIDPNSYCNGENNWTSSHANAGGTPCSINSVKGNNPDNISPEIIKIVVVDSLLIDIYFSEYVDSTSAKSNLNYIISNNIGNPDFISTNQPKYNIYRLHLSNPIQKHIIYTLEVKAGISDCSGNLSPTFIRQFGIPQLADSNDILINEVMYNPKDNGVDYVEIYNFSNKVIDLKTLRLANWNPQINDYDNVKEITSDQFQILPNQFYILTTSASAVKNQYYVKYPSNFVEMASLPKLNSTSGNIYLITNSFKQIDGMQYDESMQYSLLNNTKGISLERINYAISGMEKTNWRSAATPGNNTYDVGGTPTYENSQKAIKNINNSKWSTFPEIFSPDNDGVDDYLQINYQLSKEGYMANIKIYNSKGQLIKKLANNIYLNPEGQIIWDGIDDNGEKAKIGIYIVYIELFDNKGNTEQFKLSTVLAGKF